MEVEGRQPRALPLPAPSPRPEGSRGLSLLHSSLSHLLSRSVGSAFARVAGAAGLRRVPLSLLAEGRVPQPLPAPLGRGGPCPSTRCMRGAGVAARPGRRRPRKAPARLMRCQEVTGRLTGGEPGRNLGAQPSLQTQRPSGRAGSSRCRSASRPHGGALVPGRREEAPVTGRDPRGGVSLIRLMSSSPFAFQAEREAEDYVYRHSKLGFLRPHRKRRNGLQRPGNCPEVTRKLLGKVWIRTQSDGGCVHRRPPGLGGS